MDKKEQVQLNEATDNIKRLEKIVVLLERRINILAKENARLRSTVSTLQNKTTVLEHTTRRIIHS